MAALLLGSCAGQKTVTEKMMWSTYPVATLKGDATGFVIKSRDSLGENMAVVFTSAHVLKTMGDGPLIIGLHRQVNADEVDAEPLIIIPAKERMKGTFYVRHPTHDLAAFRIKLPEEAKKLANLGSSVDEKMLASAAVRLHAGDEVSFLGYPDVYPGTRGAFAILRSGRIATHPVGVAMAKGRFFVNADVYPGDSGAPVFLTARTGRPHLVGVLTSRIGVDERAFSHLAVVVDAGIIRETLALLKKLPPMTTGRLQSFDELE